ncbi:MAG: GNAT family protein [Chitinophagaceae bacterium]
MLVGKPSDFDKYFPPDFILETERVILRPMRKEDAEIFFPIAQSAVLWKYFTKELNDEVQLAQWILEALNDRAAGRRVPFTILDKKTGDVCGSTSFGSISFFDKRIEIGWSWLAEAFLGSGVNRHCKFALLRYAFEEMDFERVEIKTDNLNERAKQALRKIGASEEGVLRSHMQMPHNRRRDSIYFSILLKEWKKVKNDFFAGYI